MLKEVLKLLCRGAELILSLDFSRQGQRPSACFACFSIPREREGYLIVKSLLILSVWLLSSALFKTWEAFYLEEISLENKETIV